MNLTEPTLLIVIMVLFITSLVGLHHTVMYILTSIFGRNITLKYIDKQKIEHTQRIRIKRNNIVKPYRPINLKEILLSVVVSIIIAICCFLTVTVSINILEWMGR